VNKNLTEIVVILDESGSMSSIRGDTIGGFNTFLNDQKESSDGQARLTLVTFSSLVRTPIDSRDIREVEPLTELSYRPGGGTALLDAIGLTIERLEDKYTDEEDKSKIPGKVIFAIITDGEENTSKTYVRKNQIAQMIKHQTNRHGWEFAFLGANLDAVAEGRSIGISMKSSFNFAANKAGATDTFGVLSNATLAYRSSGVADYNVVGTSLENLNQSTATATPSRP
jgi:uncharacterized protein YegL